MITLKSYYLIMYKVVNKGDIFLKINLKYNTSWNEFR